MAEESHYSPTVGLIFVFNLIVGTGALAMPRAFQDAGWLLSIILVSLIAFSSYATVTLVVEAMACANAVLRRNKSYREEDSGHVGDQINSDASTVVLPDEQSLLRCDGEPKSYELITGRNLKPSDYEITQRVELGQMMSMFCNKVSVAIFYVVISIYLYGDLAIYSAAVPKSLRDVMCTYTHNTTENSSLDDSSPCWPGVDALNRINAYRLCVAVFTLLLGPFVFFNVQKTLLIQIVTSALRWIAFTSMVILACIRLSEASTDGMAQPRPPAANFAKAPTLFGVCVYAFMCHHSLPSLVTPIRMKHKLRWLFAADFVLILLFYLLLSLTGSFAFPSLPDLYTLTFEPNTSQGNMAARGVVALQYFLALYPVFTISASYPIIGITLRNNLKALVLICGDANNRKLCKCSTSSQQSWIIDRLIFPFAVLLPPLAIALATNDLQFLVGITGSYAGVGIQYFVPVALAFYGRRTLSLYSAGENPSYTQHPYRSPFNKLPWLIILMLWAAASIVLVTYNHISTGK